MDVLSNFKVGDYFSFAKRFTKEDFQKFSSISGDENPLHHDQEYSARTEFSHPIVPMHLVAAPLSFVAGMIFPGRQALYLAHTVRSLQPVFFDQPVEYSARVDQISVGQRTLTLRVVGIVGTDVVLDANLVVHVREDDGAVRADEQSQAVQIKHFRRGPPHVLVLGAAGTIGQCIALEAARNGWPLSLVARGPKGRLERTVRRCVELGSEVSVYQRDLADPGTLSDDLSAAGVDTLVHAAGPALDAPMADHISVGAAALLSISQALLPTMLRQQWGRILFLGSSAVQYRTPGLDAYAAAKAAGTQVIETLRSRYGSYGISAVTLAPGVVRSPLSAELVKSPGAALVPEQVAETAVALLRDDRVSSSYVILDSGGATDGSFGFSTVLSDELSARETAPVSAASASSLPGRPIEDTPSRVVEDVFREFFGVAEGVSVSQAAVGSWPGWDSLRHIEFLLRLEEACGIAFLSQEMESSLTFGAINRLVASKLAAKRNAAVS